MALTGNHMATAEAAIKSVEEHADDAWKAAAMDAVLKCAGANALFTVDDVWPLIPSQFQTHDDRALGPIMRNAASRGWIKQSGNFKRSWVRNHGTVRPLWRSRIYKKTGDDPLQDQEPMRDWDGKAVPPLGSPLWPQVAAGLHRDVASGMLGATMANNLSPRRVHDRIARTWTLILGALDLSWPAAPARLAPKALGPMAELWAGWERYCMQLRHLTWERNDYWRGHLLAARRVTDATLQGVAVAVPMDHLPSTLAPSANLWLAWARFPDGKKTALRPLIFETTRGNAFRTDETLQLSSLDGDWRAILPVPAKMVRLDRDDPWNQAVIRAAEWGRLAFVERGPRLKLKKGSKRTLQMIPLTLGVLGTVAGGPRT
jgi:hypothetical protein